MTRVLVVEPAGRLWGSERALLEFIDKIPDSQTLVCCPPNTPIVGALTALHIPVIQTYVSYLHEKGRLKRLWATIGIIRACLKFRPEVIYLNQAGCYRTALLASWLFDLPIVSHVRIFEDIPYLECKAKETHRFGAVIAISSSVESEIEKLKTLSSIPRIMIYDAYLLRTSGWKDRRRVANRIACVGRIVQGKGHNILIEAIHRLVKDGHEVDCIIIGDGPADLVRELRIAADEGAGAMRIHWLGLCENVLDLLRTSAALVCPSFREPLGRVIFEAWDAGAIPIACETSGGAAEIINAASGGLIYGEQTPESLAIELLKAITLAEAEASQLIENGRSWLSINCSPFQYAERMAQLFREAAVTNR